MSGFLSLVPYLGMLLALVPPVIAALPVYTALPPYLLIDRRRARGGLRGGLCGL